MGWAWEQKTKGSHAGAEWRDWGQFLVSLWACPRSPLNIKAFGGTSGFSWQSSRPSFPEYFSFPFHFFFFLLLPVLMSFYIVYHLYIPRAALMPGVLIGVAHHSGYEHRFWRWTWT